MTAPHDWYDFGLTVGKGLFGAYGLGKTVSESVKWAAKQKREKEDSHRRIVQLELQIDALARALEVSEGVRKRAEDRYKHWTARDRYVQFERLEQDRADDGAMAPGRWVWEPAA